MSQTTTQPTPAMFVNDGFTLDFEIPEEPGVSAGIRGKRRPMTNLDLALMYANCRPDSYKPPATLPQGMTEAAWIEMQIDKARSIAIARQIVSWDCTDQAGSPAPISPENISKLHPTRLLADLLDVVSGVYKKPINPNEGEMEAAQKNS